MMGVVVPIVGTVGVPARYGGFETLAEQLCANILPTDTEFVVYCQRSAYSPDERNPTFLGHKRVFLPVSANGISSLFYDALALLHAVFVIKAQKILVLGYSGAWILPVLKIIRPRTSFIINVDGMEWRRQKFSKPAKLLLKALEYCAAWSASTIIADNVALAVIIEERYRRMPVIIAYGGDHTVVSSDSSADFPNLAPRYYLAIARIEPENNAEIILQGCREAGVPLVFIGNWSANDYGRDLRRKFGSITDFQLLDPIYDQVELNAWRRHAMGYIHGHSVGGTNPSLVEALFHTDLLISFNCSFNRASLLDSGYYFVDPTSLADLLRQNLMPIDSEMISLLRERYRWRYIAAEYRALV